MGNLGDKVLQKIKEQNIRPKPRWQFLLEDYFIWLFFLISLLVGAVAFCVILHTCFTNDWDLYKYLHTTLAGHILISIPYIWLAILVAFLLIAYHNFKYTKGGYRRETYFVVGLSVVGSLILGTFLYTLGFGEKIENTMSETLPFYGKLMCCSQREDVWDQPAVGLLGGEVVAVSDDRNFDLEDFKGTVWRVQENDDTIGLLSVPFLVGERLKIIGEIKEENIFWAREIRPWKVKKEDNDRD